MAEGHFLSSLKLPVVEIGACKSRMLTFTFSKMIKYNPWIGMIDFFGFQ